jgi:hypothetical protein
MGAALANPGASTSVKAVKNGRRVLFIDPAFSQRRMQAVQDRKDEIGVIRLNRLAIMQRESLPPLLNHKISVPVNAAKPERQLGPTCEQAAEPDQDDPDE